MSWHHFWEEDNLIVNNGRGNMRTVKQTSSREIFKPEILKKNLRFNKYLLKYNKFVLTFVKVADIVHDKKSNKKRQPGIS